ncbi:unnamed protein product [Lepidochelys olivacea]
MAANDSFSLAYLGNPQPGDLIEIFRPAYQHWALYLGDGYIINVAPVEEGAASSLASAKSVFSRKALVKMQLLKDVVGSDTYRINNKYDDAYTRCPWRRSSGARSSSSARRCPTTSSATTASTL